jgi:hypothetical protein
MPDGQSVKKMKKILKKNENMISQDPIDREKKNGGKPNKSFGGERMANSIKEGFIGIKDYKPKTILDSVSSIFNQIKEKTIGEESAESFLKHNMMKMILGRWADVYKRQEGNLKEAFVPHHTDATGWAEKEKADAVKINCNLANNSLKYELKYPERPGGERYTTTCGEKKSYKNDVTSGRRVYPDGSYRDNPNTWEKEEADMQEKIEKERRDAASRRRNTENLGRAGAAAQGGAMGMKAALAAWDIAWMLVRIGLTFFIGAYWMQLLRAYKEGRMFPGMNPTLTPYTKVGSKEGEPMLSQKNFGWPFNSKDPPPIRKDEGPSLKNVVLDQFRDHWILWKMLGDWLIGLLSGLMPRSYKDTTSYKENEKSFVFNIIELFILWVVLPIVTLFGLLFAILPFKSALMFTFLKSTWNHIFNDPLKVLYLWFLVLPALLWNAHAMPMYAFYFFAIRPFQMAETSGIKEWFKHYIGKYYIFIFLYALWQFMGIVLFHFGPGLFGGLNTIIAGVIAIFVLFMAQTEAIPWQIGTVDDQGKPTPFRIPGAERLNMLLYTAVPNADKIKMNEYASPLAAVQTLFSIP